MKQLSFFFALFLSLILSSCSNNERELSPLSPQFDKTSVSSSYPFTLHQTFAELTNASIDWYNNAKGLVITVKLPEGSMGQNKLFAVVDFADVDPAVEAVQMVYLGDLSKGIYLVRGIKNRIVSSVRIYLYYNRDLQDRPEPYTEGQLFNNISIRGWKATDDIIKVSSGAFPANLKHMFAELISKGNSTLIFLGKPVSTDLEFPKSPKLIVASVRLLGYVTERRVFDPYPFVEIQ